MKLRRYYRKGTKYPYYITDKKIEELRRTYTEEELDALDNAEYDMILSPSEQESWYIDCIIRILANPRKYLDELDLVPSFRVNWNNYSKRYEKNKCRRCGKEYKSDYDGNCRCGNKDFKKVHYGVSYF